MRDRTMGTTTRVSIATGGTQDDGGSSDARLSADGRYVTFTSTAGNLVPGDGNGVSDVFVHDREFGSIDRVSVLTDGDEANGASSAARISSDDRYVAFVSEATNLVGLPGWFLHDRTTGRTDRLPNAGFASVAFEDRFFVTSTCDPFEGWIHERVTGTQATLAITAGDPCAAASRPTPDGRYVVVDAWYQEHLHGFTAAPPSSSRPA